MSGVQRVFAAILPPAWAASMERESREWRRRCTACGKDQGSVWDAGGIRWKGSGSPRVPAPCACGNRWAKLVRERTA